eukprot:Phypoly_transcript_05910.p1 GENE.Phypoly_transcript_05910~~Phypoly_transcript_05910.p1  ORF type:complete len:365 (+),score=60.60 Phypoly_transcript_05910:676-1770(+)
MASIFFVLLVLLLAVSNAAYVTNIAADGPNGQVYITVDNALYEMDSHTLDQNAAHNTTGPAEYSTLFVAKRNNRQVLYAYLDTDAGYEFVFYPRPLRNQDVLVPTKTQAMANGLSLGSTYDKHDMRAIHSVSRNLTLVNLNNLNILDSVRVWSQSRMFGRNVVYNHQNKHVIVLYTHVPYRGDYGLTVHEYDVATNKFVSTTTTYNCQCGTGYNETESPFYKVLFSEQGCSIDYSVSPAQLWCSYPEGKKLFAFNAHNLSDFRVIETPAVFDYVAWDFKIGSGFALDGYNSDGAKGFKISKIDLATGAVTATFSSSDFRLDTSVYTLDPVEPHLYVSVEGYSSIFIINTGALHNANVRAFGFLY